MRFAYVTLAAFSIGCSVPDITILDAAVESDGSPDAGDAATDAPSDTLSDAPGDGAQTGCPDAMPPSATFCCPNGVWCAGLACMNKCSNCNCNATSYCCAKNMGMGPTCTPLDAGCP